MNSLATQEHRALTTQYANEGKSVLLMLFDAYDPPFMNERDPQKRQEAIERKTAGYLYAIEGVPEWALKEAYKDFIQPRIERPASRQGKLPNPEEFGRAARVHLDHEVARQARRKNELAQLTSRQSEVDPDERVRMKFRMSVLAVANGSRIDRLAADTSLPAMVNLANEWGVPVPDEVLRQVRSIEHEG